MAALSCSYEVGLVQQLLLQAGDVETNPGPPPPGMIKSFLKDLRSVERKYKVLGTELLVPVQEIEAYEKMFKEDHVRIFAEVINRWLFGHEEEEYEELFLNEKKEFDRICPTSVYCKSELVLILCKALMDIGEVHLAEILKKKNEHQQGLLKSLQQDLHSVVDKYAIIGVELEVRLQDIYLLEAKYQNDKTAIFANVLQCWMDSYSRDSYIEDICAALIAVQECDLAESVRKKHMKEGARSEEVPVLKKEANENIEPEHTSQRKEENEGNNESISHSEPGGSPDSVAHVPLLKAAEGNITNKEREEEGSDIADGIPQGLQLLLAPPSGPPTPQAVLSFIVPDDVDVNKLKSVPETMKTHGDNDFSLQLKNGSLGNIPWSMIDWIIDSISRNSIEKVSVTVDVHFSVISQGILDIYAKGVKQYVSDAVDGKPVSVRLVTDRQTNIKEAP